MIPGVIATTEETGDSFESFEFHMNIFIRKNINN